MSSCNPIAQKSIVASSASHSTAEPIVYTVKEVQYEGFDLSNPNEIKALVKAG